MEPVDRQSQAHFMDASATWHRDISEGRARAKPHKAAREEMQERRESEQKWQWPSPWQSKEVGGRNQVARTHTLGLAPRALHLTGSHLRPVV